MHWDQCILLIDVTQHALPQVVMAHSHIDDGLGFPFGNDPSHVQLERGAWNAKIFLEIFNLHTLTSPIPQMKDNTLFIYPACQIF